MSDVERRERIETTVMEPYLSGDSFWWEEGRVEKFAWKCLGCGLVWALKGQAEGCESRGHRPTFNQAYGGYIENGVHKGGVEFVREAIRREPIGQVPA